MTDNQDPLAEKKVYRWLMAQTSPARKWLIASVLIGLLSGLLLLVQAGLLASIVHKLVIDSMSRDQLITDFVLSLIVVLVRGCCAFGREMCGFCAGAKVRADIRKALMAKLERLGPLVISRQAAGAWTTVAVEQVEDLQEFIARYLPQMSLAVLVPVVILMVVFPVNWAVAVIFCVTAPLIPVFMALVGGKAAEANRRNFDALERLGGFFLDRLQGMETLRLFRRSIAAQKALVSASEDFRSKTMEVLRLAFLSSSVLEFFASVSIALTAVYLGMSFLGYIHFGDYGVGVSLYSALFLLLLAPEFYQPLRELGSYYHAKAKAVAAAEAIVAVMNQTEPEEHQGSCSFLAGTTMDIHAKGLTVCSSIPSNLLLNNVDFSIKAGSRVAIVGASGAGKTTLMNTLMGFHPYQGELKVSGQLLSELALLSWRKNIAWLGQRPLIIAGTVMDNIAFGRDINKDQALKALERAQGLDILDKLSNALDSLLQEQGESLSVGQAQRIALARALALPVKLLLLDEPTAALDAESEQQVLKALEQLPETTTVITVTHRMHQIMSMDQVLLIDAGQLVAMGNPRELICCDGRFQTFMDGQSRSLDHG